jgi:hypothetical protein
MFNRDFINIALIYEGLKPAKTVEELMKKHKTSKKEVESALDDGEKIEMEHMKNSDSVADKKEARQIASHHIDERLDYYKLLNKVEKAK